MESRESEQRENEDRQGGSKIEDSPVGGRVTWLSGVRVRREGVLKSWPHAGSQSWCRGPLAVAVPPDRGDRPLLSGALPSPAQVDLFTDICRLSPAHQACDLIPRPVLALLPWASPGRAYSFPPHCPDSMAWLPDPLYYRPFSCWGLYLMARNPMHLPLPTCTSSSVCGNHLHHIPTGFLPI